MMMTAQLDAIELKRGSHKSREQGMCFMEAVAYIKGLPHSDRPSCTDAVVAAYARALNDAMPDAERQRLKPLIPRAAKTPNGIAPQKRAYLCADYAVRVFAVSALRAAAKGLDEWAERLASLPEINSKTTARAAAKMAMTAARTAPPAAGRAAARASWAAEDAVKARSAAQAAVDAAATVWAAAAWDEAIELLEKLLDMEISNC